MATTSGSPGGYVFSDSGTADGHAQLLHHLAGMLDPFTTRRLEQAGVRPSSRCLEVGAGTGSIAAWLAERVGPHGEVVATDLDPSRVPNHPRITTLTHDIAKDPLPGGRYDLIHARLVLAHLPNRREVLTTLAAALAPGGALVLDEFEASWDRSVMDTPDPEAYRLFTAYHQAFMAVLEQAGTDPGWGRRIHQAMREAGLVEVHTEYWARSWHGGQPGCLLAYTAAEQLRAKLIIHGMTGPDIDKFRELLLDPRLVIRGNLALSTTGRRPATAA